MGDGSANLPSLYPAGGTVIDDGKNNQLRRTNIQAAPEGTVVGSDAFYSQYSTIPPSQSRPEPTRPSPQQSQAHFNYSSAPGHGASPLNMGTMSSALPDYAMGSNNRPHSHQFAQQAVSGASTSALVYQLQQASHYPGQVPGSVSSFNPGFIPSHYPQNFGAGVIPQANMYHSVHTPQSRSAGPSPSYPNFPQHTQQYFFYPFGPQGNMPQQYGHPFPQKQVYQGRRSSLPSVQVPPPADASLLSGSLPSLANAPLRGTPGQDDDQSRATILTSRQGNPADLAKNPVPRGPPRKPKQSGHALWVGNLPPGTTVVDLKDHFSREATKDIESLFLISKSNCAFVNYRSEAACTAAMHRFHDSRFNGVRLVCRLRRSSAPASGVPTGPSAMAGQGEPKISPRGSPKPQDSDDLPNSAEATKLSESDVEKPQTARVPEKFFIVKSLTLQDLELSVRNSTWATQAHNEETLNRAFENADHVYLIFSANKSGEYFGYARMTSPIGEEMADTLRPPPSLETAATTDGPRSVPTLATEFAPKGRIIDDSARGTIFWEAEHSDDEEETAKSGDEAARTSPEGDAMTSSQTWGKPFKVEWISTNRLPFYRTRGLRNPWNANREIKIARDGTELETNVGKKLIQMFHRLGPSSASAPVPYVMPMHTPGRPF